MVQIILVCGEWVIEKKRWEFVVDNCSKRGCRILDADENTTFDEFVVMVYEDYGLDKTRFVIELSYMFGKKMLKSLPKDTPRVVVTNTRQLQGFIASSKNDPTRLCVVVKDRAARQHNESIKENKSARPNHEEENKSGGSNHEEENISEATNVEEENTSADTISKEDNSYESVCNGFRNKEEIEEDDEFESRYDCCDDPDGASSDDEDFSVYGRPVVSPILPITRRSPVAVDVGRNGYDEFNRMELSSLELRVGQRFRCKADVETRLKILSVIGRFDFNVKESDRQKLIVKCWLPNCVWKVRATTIGNGAEFCIRKYNNEHTCSVTERSGRARQATPDILAVLYKDYFLRLGPKVTPADVGFALNSRFGVQMDYWKSYRTLRCARELLTGTPEKGYADLPIYLHAVRRANPGTLTRLVVDELQRFKYLFISFSASITGFPFLRKVVVVDGTFLQGKYKGTLLVATAQDGNFQIFPLAFGIVDTENDESWEWFFTQLNIVLPDDEELAIISDRHNSIGKAIGKVYPKASRGICTYHLYKNILVRFKGQSLFKLVKKAASCYKMTDFVAVFDEIESIHPDLHSYLQRADVQMWARVHFPGDRYNIATTNIAESLNKVLSGSRSLPIARLLQEIRKILTRWFCNRRNDAQRMQTTLTSGVEKLMEVRVKYAKTLKVQMINAQQYQVTSGSSMEIVNYVEHKCSCGRFAVEKLPCAHAIAVADSKKRSPIELCHPYYCKEYLCSAYNGSIMPADMALPVPDHVAAQICLPPLVRQPPGRPKNSRIKSCLEIAMQNKRPRKEYTCSRCHQGGHNVKTCRVTL